MQNRTKKDTARLRDREQDDVRFAEWDWKAGKSPSIYMDLISKTDHSRKERCPAGGVRKPKSKIKRST